MLFTAGKDYIAVSRVITFVSGQSAANFAIPINDDNIYKEPNITFSCRIFSERDDVIILTNDITITIVDGELVMKWYDKLKVLDSKKYL